jgi:hypothetical protein
MSAEVYSFILQSQLYLPVRKGPVETPALVDLEPSCCAFEFTSVMVSRLICIPIMPNNKHEGFC